MADAEWVLETYEPRVDAENIIGSGEAVKNGEFALLVDIDRKEDEEE